MAVISFDVGGTYVKYGLIEDSHIVQKGKFKTDKFDKDSFLSSLAAKIEELSLLASIKGIGISFPGFIDTVNGVPILAGAITSINGVNIVNEVKRRLTMDCPIYIENDANCAAIAEKYNGAAIDNNDFILLTLGTGVGGAIYYQNQTIKGHSYRAGELGMMLTDYGEYPNKTLHELASTSALISLYKEKYRLPPEAEITGEEIFSLTNDYKVEAIIREWSKYVAVAIFNSVVIFNPEKVLIGGGISQNPALYPYINEALNSIPYWQDFIIPVEICRHYNDSGLWGAYILVENHLKQGECERNEIS
ncbi:NagC/XylR family transcriptional regulator [Niallia circulans]|uniref:ROK family protein n=1 Tax=Niallia circulans TaxID=1397 RepID=UPI00077C2039|nr:ROK family protein [Niallia circulans]MED3839525.1 ROK family protein [Niallia circulans]MED4242597.1 ROK family protein [Niallia circulans]MED4246575.1 ROK family protein [Niallia circulans]QKH62174.1 ROK family protein [Niallia circulans]SPU10387.1 NagC/XylR family transcriptional regulator [Niallia circulans]